jgi:hypothetical protein
MGASDTCNKLSNNKILILDDYVEGTQKTKLQDIFTKGRHFKIFHTYIKQKEIPLCNNIMLDFLKSNENKPISK